MRIGIFLHPKVDPLFLRLTKISPDSSIQSHPPYTACRPLSYGIQASLTITEIATYRLLETRTVCPRRYPHPVTVETAPIPATEHARFLQRKSTKPTSNRTPVAAAIPASNSHQITGRRDEPENTSVQPQPRR